MQRTGTTTYLPGPARGEEGANLPTFLLKPCCCPPSSLDSQQWNGHTELCLLAVLQVPHLMFFYTFLLFIMVYGSDFCHSISPVLVVLCVMGHGSCQLDLVCQGCLSVSQVTLPITLLLPYLAYVCSSLNLLECEGTKLPGKEIMGFPVS